ncbi:hypothetical protein GOP47_0026874 [Adiantum capillus-veneris]|nr:hypothetical protein GOP47_0026874 [Adiantum capillus-veneris]
MAHKNPTRVLTRLEKFKDQRRSTAYGFPFLSYYWFHSATHGGATDIDYGEAQKRGTRRLYAKARFTTTVEQQGYFGAGHHIPNLVLLGQRITMLMGGMWSKQTLMSHS